MGDLTFSLVWNDESDLDLWVTMPSGELVWYQSKKSSCGAAELDIDMNANYVKSKEPVENVYVGDAEAGVARVRVRVRVAVRVRVRIRVRRGRCLVQAPVARNGRLRRGKVRGAAWSG